MKYFRKISVLLYVLGAILLFIFNNNSADATTTYGSSYIFNSATSYYTRVAGLYNSRFVVAYQDYGNSYYGTAKYCDISGTDITGCSTGAVFNFASQNEIRISRLTDSTFVVVYTDGGNSNYGTAVIGSISGTTITFGSEYVFHNSSTWYPSVDRLSDTKFVVVYRDGNMNGVARIGDVSGTSIIWGSETTYKNSTNGADYNYVSSLIKDSSPYKFVVAYRDNDNTYDGKTIIGTVDGNTITFGTSEVTFDTGTANFMGIARLNDNKFAISYQDQATSRYGFSIIGEVNGYSISYGNRSQFNDAQSDYINIAALNEYSFITVFRNGLSSLFYGTAITSYVTDDVISFGDKSVFNSGNTGFSSISYMPDTPANVVISFMNASNSNYGTAIIGQEDEPGGPAVPEFSSLALKIIIGSMGFMMVIFFGIYVKKKIISSKTKK